MKKEYKVQCRKSHSQSEDEWQTTTTTEHITVAIDSFDALEAFVNETSLHRDWEFRVVDEEGIVQRC